MWFHLYAVSRIGKSIKTESSLVVARLEKGEGEMEPEGCGGFF